jgi:peptidoglycan/LPS O-acetylase OafA/YrhL
VKNPIYFPGLNGLRAIAAMIVMIFHTDQFSHYFGLVPYGFWRTRMQSYAVILFFVLSGFLITYLLVKEKEKEGLVNIRNFYIRRILRIWPVYYLVLITGAILLACLPAYIYQGVQHNLPVTLVAYGLLVPNIASYFGYAPDLINVLWSVGAEEQFYAGWPWLVQHGEKLMNRIILFLFAWLALKYFLHWLHFPKRGWGPGEYIPFDYMAIGGIAACLYNNNSRKLQYIYHPLTQVIAWMILVISILYKPLHLPFVGILNTDFHGVIYAIIILNVSTNPATLVNLENKVFNFLGKISYGIYGFHFLVLFVISLILRRKLATWPSLPAHLIMFGLEITVTILVAWLSGKYYEAWFLKQKLNFTVHSSKENGVEATPIP